MKLYITDNGDPSVGIRAVHFDVDCPFNKEDVETPELNEFRESILRIYKEYGEGKVTAFYDFELQAMNS